MSSESVSVPAARWPAARRLSLTCANGALGTGRGREARGGAGTTDSCGNGAAVANASAASTGKTIGVSSNGSREAGSTATRCQPHRPCSRGGGATRGLVWKVGHTDGGWQNWRRRSAVNVERLTADGRVVAGCFSKELNPPAPNVILPGTGPEIERWARVFAEQRTAVPVFIKQRSNEWYCMGAFRCVRLADDPHTIESYASRANRSDVTTVLFLERER